MGGPEEMEKADDHAGASQAPTVFMILEVKIGVAVETIAMVGADALPDYTEGQWRVNAIPSGMAPSPNIIHNAQCIIHKLSSNS